MASNNAYPSIWGPVVEQTVDLIGDVLKLQLVDATFVFDAADVTLADIDAGMRVGPLTTVTGTRSMDGATLVTATADQTVTAVSGDPVAGWVYVIGGATDADRLLVAHVGRRSDTTPIYVVPDDGDMDVLIPAGRILTIGGG